MPTCPICGGAMLEDELGSNTYTCVRCGHTIYLEDSSSSYDSFDDKTYLDEDDDDNF